MPLQQKEQLNLEGARVRDLLRYYKPHTKQHHAPAAHNGSLLGICHEAEPIIAGPPSAVVATEAPDDAPDDSKLLAHDATLTAFAQLGAFRLNCQRSFISLIDHENQYILAEATRSVSLNLQGQCDQGDEIYLGARVLDAAWGVCPNTIQVFTAKDGGLDVSTPTVLANQECYVMNDLSAIDSFKDRPYVAGWPYMRFYAEVPIHSPTGHVIGTFCVVDDKPREGLDKKGLHALSEISSAIMKHLELIQMQHDLRRAGEMVKGLGMFVEGKSNPPQECLDGPGIDLTTSPGRPSIHRSGTVRTLSERGASTDDTTCYTTTSTLSPEQRVVEGMPVGNEPPMVSWDQKTPHLPDATYRSRERKLATNDVTATHESLASAGTKQLFSRACYLVREALDLDGTIFIDACFRDITCDPVKPTPMPPPPVSLRSRGMPYSAGSDSSEALDNVETTQPTNETVSLNQDSVAQEAETDRCLSSTDLLGYSVKDPSIISGVSSNSGQILLPQSTLRGLLRKYRNGHTFVFDEDGSIIQNLDEIEERQISDNRNSWTSAEYSDLEKEKTWARRLLAICPGARSIIFFPLWDPQRDQWFAGSLAWTTDPTRIIQSADVTYLAAFGSCIMSEKSRLDAMTADRAKADFISSVSHELRSPLHGVLASAEALQDTSTGLMQDDMIRTITICGEVLLDTMDQILDYAKMSNSINALTPKANRNLDSRLRKVATLDLSDLAETVMEGIFVGHSYRSSTFGYLDGNKESKPKDSTTFTIFDEKVMIILSIDWQTSWIFESQVGGWKRILVNLFGNALKYTHTGFIQVSLKAQTIPASAALPVGRIITLQIDDSGKGMSKDYLKYNLFTPFAQEDQLSDGTGLGLSIVRQLVADLGGEIDVQSEVGYGTTVKVSVPLDDSPRLSDHVPLESTALIRDVRARCRGLTLCLVNFEYYPDIGDVPTGILSPHARRMHALKQSLTAIVSDWFGLEVTTASSLTSAKGHIKLGIRSKLDLPDAHVETQPLIIFEDTMAGTHSLDTKGVYYLSMPAGPHKVARILALCLGYISSSADLSNSRDSATTESASSLPVLLDKFSISNGIDRQPTSVLAKSPLAESDQSENLTLPAALSVTLPSQLKEYIFEEKKVLDLPRITVASLESPQRSRVLLVEDNSINMKILVHFMKSAKQDYLTAANGLEALQEFQAAPQSFKVIFMDLSMPTMDGLTSSRHMRLHERENTLPRTRIVALTCFSSAEYQRDAALSGIDLFLIKPVLMKTLKPILNLDPEKFGDL